MRTSLREKNTAAKPVEIPEKELNDIMKTVGDLARAQTVELKRLLRDNLRRELASARTAWLKQC